METSAVAMTTAYFVKRLAGSNVAAKQLGKGMATGPMSRDLVSPICDWTILAICGDTGARHWACLYNNTLSLKIIYQWHDAEAEQYNMHSPELTGTDRGPRTIRAMLNGHGVMALVRSL